MTDKIKDTETSFLFDYGNFRANRMIYLKPKSFGTINRNIGIYYRKGEKKKEGKRKTSEYSHRQKIIIRTPKMRVPFEVGKRETNGYKSYYMSLSFGANSLICNEEELSDLYDFMQEIDTANKEIASENMSAWKLPSGLRYVKTLQKLKPNEKYPNSDQYPHHITLNLPYSQEDGYLFSVYDEEAKKSSIDIIKKGCYVTAIIELSELLFYQEKETKRNIFRPVWNVLQIRKARPYSSAREHFMKNCALIDPTDPADQQQLQMAKYVQMMQAMPMMPPGWPGMMPGYQIPGAPPPPPGMPGAPPPPGPRAPADPKFNFKPPSKDQLLGQIKKLRKTADAPSPKKEEEDSPTKKLIAEKFRERSEEKPKKVPSPPPPPGNKASHKKDSSDDEKSSPKKKVDNKPSKKVDDKPSKKVDEKPSKKVDEKPSRKVDEKPSRKVDEKPSKKVNDKHVKKPGQATTKKIAYEDSSDEEPQPKKAPPPGKKASRSDDKPQPKKKPVRPDDSSDDEKPVRKGATKSR